ncbi:hypothetical protein ACSSV1_006109 [Labrenzia sp. MBR-25]
MVDIQPDDMAGAHTALAGATDQETFGGCDGREAGESAMSGAPCAALGNCFHGMLPPTVAFFVHGKAHRYLPLAETFRDVEGAPEPFPPRLPILS